MNVFTESDTYEYRVKKIVKDALSVVGVEGFANGDELHYFLYCHRKDLANALLDDIETYMGFDDLLKQVKNG